MSLSDIFSLEEILKDMKDYADDVDQENSHIQGDDLLLAALRLISYETEYEGIVGDIIDEWERIRKHYA